MKILANINCNQIVVACKCESDKDTVEAYGAITNLTGGCEEPVEAFVDNDYHTGDCPNGTKLQAFYIGD